MSAALNMLKRILALGGKDAERVATRVGDEFYRAAEEIPDMFQRGRKYALTDPGLEQQFGLQIDRSLAQPGTSSGSGSGFFIPPTGTARGSASMSVVDMPEMAKNRWDQGRIFDDFSKLPMNARFAEIDASNLSKPGSHGGGGAGRGAYAAMYGSLLQDPRIINYTSALSARNAYRRNFNQAAALLRDPKLSKQIMVDPDQIRNMYDVSDAMQFRALVPEDQVGRLQIEGALQTLDRLEKTARHPEAFDDARGPLGRIMRETLQNAEDPKEFARAADLLRSSGAPAHLWDTVGASALRRAALVGDIVEGRRLRRDLFRGVEFRRGGAVK